MSNFKMFANNCFSYIEGSEDYKEPHVGYDWILEMPTKVTLGGKVYRHYGDVTNKDE